MADIHSTYMHRCFELARMAANTGTNPRVGAVIAHEHRIIGEGYYQEWGGPHAEVRAIANVRPNDRPLLTASTLYVSLEPCCIHGKTPPCTDAVIAAGIPTVHIGTIDPFPSISGRGVALLQDSGVKVRVHDSKAAKKLIAPFVTYQLKKRPFITLKYAESADHFISKRGEQTWLTGPATGVYTHQLRASADAILVGTTTAIVDNPTLTTRHYPGSDAIRLVIDKDNRVPATHHLLSDEGVTVIFNNEKRSLTTPNKTQVTSQAADKISEVLDYCYRHKVQHLLVEGGAKLMKTMIDADLWDIATVITTPKVLHQGVRAPLIQGKKIETYHIGDDVINVIQSQGKF